MAPTLGKASCHRLRAYETFRTNSLNSSSCLASCSSPSSKHKTRYYLSFDSLVLAVPMEIACYQDALRLAQAQNTVGPTKAQPTNGIKDTSVPPTFNQNYLSPLYANAHEADYVCQLATLHLVGVLQSSKPGGNTSNCAEYRCSFLPLHILPHQRKRMMHCWYFIKLCTLSFLWSSLCRSRDSILRDMEVTEV